MEEAITSIYQDIPRVYTAIAEWMCCMVFCFLYKRKVKPVKFGFTALAALVLQTGWLVITRDLPIEFWIPCMVMAILFMFLFLFLVIDVPITMTVYCCMKAFLIAEFMASLEWQLEFFIHGGKQGFSLAGAVILPLVYGGTVGIIWLIEAKKKWDKSDQKAAWRELGSVFLIVLSAFALSNISFVYRNTPFSSSIIGDVFTIRTLVDLAGLAILYAYQNLRYEINAEKELLKIQSMLTAQYEKYRNYQEVTNLIDMKYHDLKHQIAGLRAENDPQKRAQWIDQLELELAVYQPERQTGNQVLDGVLDGKMPVIHNNHIHFTCVADGKLLSFMHVTDICTIFGNALDNAIEHVLLVQDMEKRIVHLEVSARKQFVYAEVRNYCESEIKMRNGFPVTTKKDSANHGFGIKSISYTVRKYGGTIQFEVKDRFFSMRILIPNGMR